MIKAVIYDLDGLMVNSEPLQNQATSQAIEKLGGNFAILPEERINDFYGRRLVDIFAELIDFFKLGVSLEEALAVRRKIFFNLIKDKLELMPGLEYSLDFCRAKGLKIAIASSGTAEYINFVLDNFNLREYFDVVISADDVKAGKPDPEPYSVTVKKLGFKPEECLVLEDADNGIESAKAAGCLCLAVRSINSPNQQLLAADLVVDSLADIGLAFSS